MSSFKITHEADKSSLYVPNCKKDAAPPFYYKEAKGCTAYRLVPQFRDEGTAGKTTKSVHLFARLMTATPIRQSCNLSKGPI